MMKGALAQLARAPALHAGGQGFETLRLHHSFSINKNPVSQRLAGFLYIIIQLNQKAADVVSVVA